MIKAYINFWKLALKPEGRSSRADYWWVFLLNSIIRLILLVVEFVIISNESMKILGNAVNTSDFQQLTQQLLNNMPDSIFILGIVGTVFSLLIMIPVTTLTARRLRDAGFSPALAYPLPAVYLANAAAQFMPTIAFLGSITTFAAIYALILLILCAKKAPDSERTI